MEYKTTLNLPKTNFSMKANLASLEPKLLSYWQNIGIYEKLLASSKDKKQFLLHDGPPYANGSIHIGHALNKILKDIIIKQKTLSGFSTPYVPGWDCHGLPVEHQLFKELGKTKHDVLITDFRKKARDFALKYVEHQKKDFQKLAIFGDWDKPYLTLDPNYEYSVIKILSYLNSQGYLYRGRKPVNWCASCETALAEAEVEYNDKESYSIYVLFKVIDDKGLFKNKDVSFIVWTTTPWTLVSNVAVALHPDLEYCLVSYKGKTVLVGQSRLDALAQKLETQLETIATFKGRDLENINLAHPFLERKSPVLLADFVSSEDGSGCVHIAPGHGEEDFSLTRKYNIPIIMPVNDKGIFEEPEQFKGKNIKEANEAVLATLDGKGVLLKAEKISHSYPHCWRCKNPIIFRATFQWFLKIDHEDLRKKLINETENVRWVPSGGKERMKGMLLTRPDWCLSRQRLWGIPIPAVKCTKCSQVYLDTLVLDKTADIFKQKGADSWFTLDISEFLPKDFKCQCGCHEFTKEFDILDVWFESGASFFAVVKNNPQFNFPADMYLEGSDQHRGWFQVSLIPSVAKEKQAPFKTILTHGFVVDGEGRKMSKSLGNVIAPQDITKNYGAEILRLWAAYSDYSEDVKISDGIIKQLVDAYRKIRNTIRFIMGNLYDFDIAQHPFKDNDLTEIDRYMLSKLALLAKEVNGHYLDYSFYKVVQAVFNFCNLDLSSFYLDILKDRLYTFSPNSKERRGSQFVLYQTLNVLLKLIAPILCFTAEEAYSCWDKLPDKKESIFLTGGSNDLSQYSINEGLVEKWNKILDLRSSVLKEIEKQREKGIIGSSLEAKVILKFKGAELDFFLTLKDVLREVFVVSQIDISDGVSAIVVEKADGIKCLRCWNHRVDIDCDKEFSGVCSRCAKALRDLGHKQA